MSFLSYEELLRIPFKHLGKNVKISSKASIYNPEQIEIGDNSRIDDFCVISGRVRIGKFVHITVFCNVAGGIEGVEIDDFATLAYGCHVFSQSDDYSGETMTNSTVPESYKNVFRKKVYVGKYVILGTGTIVFPGVTIAEGCATGAGTIVRKSTESWYIYVGNPARKLKPRSNKLVELAEQFLDSIGSSKDEV